jgi:hypothetical protein
MSLAIIMRLCSHVLWVHFLFPFYQFHLSTNYFLTEQGSKFKMIFRFEGGRINVNMKDLMITSEMLPLKGSGTPDNVGAIQVRCIKSQIT